MPAGCTRRAQPNILLIVLDTLRPDRLGSYGSTRGLTPFLDSLAARGFVFRNAYAQTSWTNASIASLFTSRYQSQHRVTSFQSVLPDTELTLSEVLKQHGYATAAFSANFLVRGDLGFGQGFDDYQAYSRPDTLTGRTYTKERAGRVNQESLAWLDRLRHDRNPLPPIFLYLHYMEPHNPYDPPDAFLDKVLNGRERPDAGKINRAMNLSNILPFSDDMVQAVKDFYDAEVMSLDAQLREQFAALQSRGFLDNAIVVMLADHGEEFREHGLMGHHQTLYEEVIRVPLIILVPGHGERVDVSPIVSLTDIAPTLLDLVGMPAPPRFEGASLRDPMGIPRWRWGFLGAATRASAPSATDSGVAFSELIKETTARQRPHEHAVITDSSKLIVGVNGEHEFYDLMRDPGETNAQALGEPERQRLDHDIARLRQLAAPATPGAAATPDAETRERMRALGYAE